ncbi:MAG TPA: enoyl-CoA hydratase [Usitatibacter sp.]|nr:enoyl-CoA hydratase [Usitatibacter sp.]
MDVLLDRDGAVQRIGFNRPQRRNAITAEMYTALADAIEAAERDDAVRVMLLHGVGGSFTAGNDIEDFVRRPPSDESTPVFRFLRVMSAAAKPFVAAVNGSAVGIGTTLLLHCDLVYAGEDAKFQLPFVSLGVVPEFASSYLLPRVAGHARAAEMLLLGQSFDARRALEGGIVTAVAPAADTLRIATEAAQRLASLPAKSVRLTKQLMKAAHAGAVQEQLAVEGRHFRAMLSEPAAREALNAFLEKRKPDFSKT